jgi:hypothetical protein
VSGKRKRKHEAAFGYRGSRSMVTFYVAHPDARPCRRCNHPTDQADIAYTTALVGVGLCIACLRAEEARALADLEGHAPTLDRREAAILADPRYTEDHHAVARQDAEFLNAQVTPHGAARGPQ